MFIKRLVKPLFSLITTIGFAGCGAYGATEMIKKYYVPLSNQLTVSKNIQEFGADDKLLTKNGLGENVRFVSKNYGIVINVDNSVNVEYTDSIKNTANYMNTVFSLVNNRYTFQVVVNGSSDFYDTAVINIGHQNDDSLTIREDEVTNVAGIHWIDKCYTANLTINNALDNVLLQDYAINENSSTLNKDRSDRINFLNRVFTQELLTILGLHEVNEEAYKGQSIMYSGYEKGDLNSYKLFPSDLKALTSLYGDTAEKGYNYFINYFNSSWFVQPATTQNQNSESGVEQ